MAMEGTISTTLNKAAEYSMAPEAITLRSTEDKFGGLIIDSQHLPEASEASFFHASLKHSLLQWRDQGKHGVWLKLPQDLSALVPLAIQEGFQYHHAMSTHVMLVKWLTDEPSTIPANASHQVGVGAFVLNADGEVQAVQEKCAVFQDAGTWKMPTGSVSQGEDIFAGAFREVKEETGLHMSTLVRDFTAEDLWLEQEQVDIFPKTQYLSKNDQSRAGEIFFMPTEDPAAPASLKTSLLSPSASLTVSNLPSFPRLEFDSIGGAASEGLIEAADARSSRPASDLKDCDYGGEYGPETRQQALEVASLLRLADESINPQGDLAALTPGETPISNTLKQGFGPYLQSVVTDALQSALKPITTILQREYEEKQEFDAKMKALGKKRRALDLEEMQIKLQYQRTSRSTCRLK